MIGGDRLVMHSKGIREMLLSRDVFGGVNDAVQRVANMAGPGFLGTVIYGRNRVHGSVITDTYEARVAEHKHRSLTSAISAGFGRIR